MHLCIISIGHGQVIKEEEEEIYIYVDLIFSHFKDLPPQCRVIRAMSSFPAVVQSGASVFTKGFYADEYDGTVVSTLFKCVGLVEEVPEHLLDSATSLSASGPAYVSSNKDDPISIKDTVWYDIGTCYDRIYI